MMIDIAKNEIPNAIKHFKNLEKISKQEAVWVLNDAATQYKKTVPDFVRKFYTIKKGAIGKRVKVQKANQRRNVATIMNRRIPPPSLFSFKKPKAIKGKGGGVRIEVIKGQKGFIEGAFIQRVDGNLIVMARKYKSQKTKYKTKGFKGVSIGAMLSVKENMNQKQIEEQINKSMKDFYERI